jgi:hypothetical protein
LTSARYVKSLYFGGGVSFYREENTLAIADSSSSGLSSYTDKKSRDIFGLNILVGYDHRIQNNFIVFTEACYSMIFDGDNSMSTMRPLGGFKYYHNLNYFKISFGARFIIPLTKRRS